MILLYSVNLTDMSGLLVRYILVIMEYGGINTNMYTQTCKGESDYFCGMFHEGRGYHLSLLVYQALFLSF